MSDKLIAYWGDPELKTLYLNRLKLAAQNGILAPHENDWQNNVLVHGGFFACLSQTPYPERVEQLIGMPESLVLLVEEIFDQLPADEGYHFVLEVLKTIMPGMLLDYTVAQIAGWMLSQSRTSLRSVNAWLNDLAASQSLRGAAEALAREKSNERSSADQWQQAWRSIAIALLRFIKLAPVMHHRWDNE